MEGYRADERLAFEMLHSKQEFPWASRVRPQSPRANPKRWRLRWTRAGGRNTAGAVTLTARSDAERLSRPGLFERETRRMDLETAFAPNWQWDSRHVPLLFPLPSRVSGDGPSRAREAARDRQAPRGARSGLHVLIRNGRPGGEGMDPAYLLILICPDRPSWSSGNDDVATPVEAVGRRLQKERRHVRA
jgi:hypothetical protein